MGFCFIYKQWDFETEQEDLLKMHIGIMPLKQVHGLKEMRFQINSISCLQYSGNASPTQVNSFDHFARSNKACANNKDEWKSYLKKLIADASLRSTMGEAAREHIEKNYSLHSLLPAFISLFS